MTIDHDYPPAPFILSSSFGNVAYARSVVVTHLRRMADDADPYRRFTYLSPWIKNIWRAAAGLLDKQDP